MPELGRATYFLVLDSQQFDAGLAEADASATKITTSIGQKLGMVGTEAQAAGAEVGAAGTEMAGGFEKAGAAAQTGAAEAKAGATEMVAAADTAAAGVTTASTVSKTAWGKMGTSIGAMGTKSFGVWKLAGLAAVYEVAKGGIHWLKETNSGTLQFNAALKATHDVSGTSTQALLKFSDSANSLATGGGRAAVMQMQKILLGFTNIRNEGSGAAAIFDRVQRAAEDISARTGRSVTTVAVALGKAFQDPVKYMNTLGRAGVTFNKQQQQVVASLIAAGKPLQAQQYMLQLLGRYTGAASAQTKSFSGQLAVAKGHLAESSALMVHAFIPAFVTFVGILEKTAGFLAQHTTAVKYVTFAYLAWKGASLAVGIGMKIVNSSIIQGIAGWLGFGRAAQTSSAEAKAAMIGVETNTTTLIEEIRILNRTLMGMAPAAEEGASGAILSLKGVNTALAGTTVTAGETAAAVETDMAVIGASAGSAAGEVGLLRLGLLGIAGTVVTAAILLDIIPHSSAGQNDLNAAGLGFLGHTPVLGGLFTQSGRFGNWLRGKVGRGSITGPTFSGPPSAPKGYDAGSYGQGMSTRANPGGYLKKGTAADRRFRKAHPGGISPQGHGVNSPAFLHWQMTHPGGTWAQYQAYRKQQRAVYKSLHPGNFSQGSDVLGAVAGKKLQQFQIAYDQAQLTKSMADDKRVLGQEYDFLKHILKTRKLSLDQKKTILDQMVSIHSTLMSLNSKIANAASPTLTKLLGPKYKQLDIEEQKAKQSGNLEKDKKALKNEEDFIKGLLKNRQLSLASRQKLEHQLTTVEDKIKAINKKMAANAKSSQTSEMEAFNELQGTFFGQFAPNIFGSTPKGLTLGSQRVKQPVPHPHRRQHHAMGGVIHYARGGAVDTRFVREAPHYASHEARFHRAGLTYFEANSPTREQRRGTDTVPAMLTPGELVLNRDQQRMLRGRLGMSRSGSANELFSAIQHGVSEHDSALVLRLAHHQLSMERGGSRAPYRKDISTWLRQFQGMSKAQRSSAQDWWGTNYGEIRRGYAFGGPVGGTTKHTHHHHHQSAPSGRASISYIEREARRMGLDVGAVMGVASGEGLSGGIGDHGTSFGPWQLHKGGAYPRWAPQGEMAAQRWAWSRAGINYALGRMAAVARGLHGRKAARAIINRFERPANPMSDYNAYLTYVGSHGMGGPTMRQGNYSAPFSRNSVFERVDQGVDYLVKGAVHAVGAGKIVSITGGMAGGTGTIIKERLNRPIKINGRTYYGIYYSEGAAMTKAGQRVRAGQNVMGGGGVEIGFLNSKMQMPPLRGGLGAGTKSDRAGYDFAALVSDLRNGKRVGLPPGLQIGHNRKVVKRGNRWVMFPDAAGAMSHSIFPDIGGISGLVPGVSPSGAPSAAQDTVPAMLTPGEMVLNAQQQELLRQKLGLTSMVNTGQLFNAITNPSHFHFGGPVGASGDYHKHKHPHKHPHKGGGLFSGLASAIGSAVKGVTHVAKSYVPVAAAQQQHYYHSHRPVTQDHPSQRVYYIPGGRGGAMAVSHVQYMDWWRSMHQHPDSGFSLSGALGSVGSWFHNNLGRERDYGKLGTAAVGVGHAARSFGYGEYNFFRGFGRPHSVYTQRANRFSDALIASQQKALGQTANTVFHPGRSAKSDLMLGLMLLPITRLTRGPIEGLDFEANLKTVAAQRFGRVAGMAIQGSHFRASDAERERTLFNLRAAMADGRLSLNDFEHRAAATLSARTRGDLLRLNHDLVPTTKGVISRDSSFAKMSWREKEKLIDAERATRSFKPWELTRGGRMVRKIGRGLYSGLMGHDLPARTGGLGIVGTKRENMVIWNQVMKSRTRMLDRNPKAANMWQIPESHLWRGGDPVSAVGFLNDYVLQYSQFAPWYDAMGLTMQHGSSLEKSMFGRDISPAQLAAIKALTSPRNRVPANLRLAIDAARHTHGSALTPETLRAMSQGMGYAHAVPGINRLMRGAHGLGHSKLGLPGDVLAGGPKTPSYFHNIMHSIFPDQYPSGAVTIDTIAGDALIPGMAKLEKDKLFKRDRHYGLFAEIYRQIGARRGMLGKEAQASVWVPHRAFMASTARGGTGNLGRLGGAVDWLDVFGEKYNTLAQRRLARRISGTGYGGLGIVSHDTKPLSASWKSGVAGILDDWSGEGALNAGVFHVQFEDGTDGVVKFLKGLLGRPEDKLANEILHAQVAHAVGAYVPDMMPLGESGFAMRTAGGHMGADLQHHITQEAFATRAGHRLDLLDTLVGNSDRHGANFKIDPQFGPVGFDADLLFLGGRGYGEFTNSGLMTEYDYRYLDKALARLRPVFHKLGRSDNYGFLMDQWQRFKRERIQLKGHGDPLVLRSEAEIAPYYGGRVFSLGNHDPSSELEMVKQMARGHRESVGMGGGQISSEFSPTRHYPRSHQRWTDGGYVQKTDWTWDENAGEYRRRSQITPFMEGNKQIFGMGQNTRDIFHALMDHFGSGSLNRADVEEAYRAMKINPRGPRTTWGKSRRVGYDAAVEALRKIGINGPRDLFMGGVRGNKAQQRGVSGLIQHLHDLYHYPWSDDRFRRGGGLGIVSTEGRWPAAVTERDPFLISYLSGEQGGLSSGMIMDKANAFRATGGPLDYSMSEFEKRARHFASMNPAFQREIDKLHRLVGTEAWDRLPLRKQTNLMNARARASLAYSAIKSAPGGLDLYLAHNKRGELAGAANVDTYQVKEGSDYWSVPLAGAVGGAGNAMFRQILHNASMAGVGLKFSGTEYGDRLYELMTGVQQDYLGYFRLDPERVAEMAKNPMAFASRSVRERLKTRPAGFSTGGTVNGAGTGDTVPAMLTPGELVLNSAQQILLRQRLGLTALGSPTQLFNEIAGRHFAAGGIVEGLDLAQHGQPAVYSTATPSLGYAQKRDIARLVGIEARARELYSSPDRGHTLHYEQHNSYSELPKDPFEEARQMKQAVHASFQT